MAVAPGARLLGETLQVRRRHTVASLSRQTRLHPKTLNRALVLSGLLPEGDADRVDGNLSVEAQAGERLAERLQKATSVKKLPEYLKCNRMQAEQLVRHGFVKRIGGKDATAETMSNMVPTEELDRFLVRFRAQGLPAKGRGGGLRSVVDAARIARRPVHEIVRLVVDGSLARIELLEEKFRFESVLIDPEEVGKALDAREARGRLSIREASARLNLANSGVRTLATNIGRDGQPLLRASIEWDQMTTRIYWFDPQDIEMFAADHVELAGLARERGATINTLRKQLKTDGIEPILPSGSLEKLLYRRSDL